MTLYIILWQLKGLNRERYRVTFYFGCFMVISIPEMIRHIRRKEDRMILLGNFSSYYVCILR